LINKFPAFTEPKVHHHHCPHYVIFFILTLLHFIKLSLWLTKYHAMMMHPLLNQAPHHEDIWKRGGIAPHILNLSPGGRGVVSFTPQPHHPLRKDPLAIG
jgi:hypothetical protein